MQFLFTGSAARVYPDVMVEGRVLVAVPGDKRRFDGEPPGDGLWVEYVPPKQTPAKPDKASKES